MANELVSLGEGLVFVAKCLVLVTLVLFICLTAVGALSSLDDVFSDYQLATGYSYGNLFRLLGGLYGLGAFFLSVFFGFYGARWVFEKPVRVSFGRGHSMPSKPVSKPVFGLGGEWGLVEEEAKWWDV